MKKDRASQTALKVGYNLLSLSAKDDWAERLPAGLVEMTERLLLASGVTGYTPRLIRAATKPWMLRIQLLQDRMMPGQFEGFGHRKISMQRQVEDAIAAGATQVLVLGAGIDTLCLRLAPEYPEVTFFEVDHPATSVVKAKGVAQEGRPNNMTMIAADLSTQPLSTVLSEHDGWDTAARSVLVAEGFLPYLRDLDVHDLLSEAAASVPVGSRLAFTHFIPNDRKLMEGLLKLTGEPALSSVTSEDLPEYVDGTGWVVTSEVDTDPAHGIEGYAVAERR